MRPDTGRKCYTNFAPLGRIIFGSFAILVHLCYTMFLSIAARYTRSTVPNRIFVGGISTDVSITPSIALRSERKNVRARLISVTRPALAK